MKKKILIIFSTFLFIFLFSSCAKADFVANDCISFAIKIESSGKITQTISFPAQIEIMQISEENKEKYISDLALAVKSKIFFPYFVNFYTTGVLKGVEKYNLGGEKMNYNLPTYNAKTKSVDFSFSFADAETWAYYHNSISENEGLEIDKGVFVNVGKSRSEFIFSQVANFDGKKQTLGEYFLSILRDVQKKFCKTTQDVKFAYKYSHFSKKLRTNADLKFEEEGQSVNVWLTDYEGLEKEKSVEIFVYSPNRAIWYVFAIVLTLVIMFLAIFIKKTKCNRSN